MQRFTLSTRFRTHAFHSLSLTLSSDIQWLTRRVKRLLRPAQLTHGSDVATCRNTDVIRKSLVVLASARRCAAVEAATEC